MTMTAEDVFCYFVVGFCAIIVLIWSPCHNCTALTKHCKQLRGFCINQQVEQDAAQNSGIQQQDNRMSNSGRTNTITLHSSLTHAQHNEMYKNFRILTYLSSMSMTCLTIVLYLNYTYYAIVVGTKFMSQDSSIPVNIKTAVSAIRLVTEICLSIGLISLRLFHLWELQTSFKDTAYALTSRSFYFIGALLLFTFIISIFSLILHHGFGIDSIDDNLVLGICLSFQSIFELRIAYLFARKLLSLAVKVEENHATTQLSSYRNNMSRNSANTTNTNINNNGKKYSTTLSLESSNSLSRGQTSLIITEKQEQMLSIATKQTVLTTISAFLSIILSILFTSLVSHSGNIHLTLINVLEASLCVTIFVICVTIIPTTLWLSFTFAHEDYIRKCSKCHRWWLFMYRNIVLFRIARKAHKIAKQENANANINGINGLKLENTLNSLPTQSQLTKTESNPLPTIAAMVQHVSATVPERSAELTPNYNNLPGASSVTTGDNTSNDQSSRSNTGNNSDRLTLGKDYQHFDVEAINPNNDDDINLNGNGNSNGNSNLPARKTYGGLSVSSAAPNGNPSFGLNESMSIQLSPKGSGKHERFRYVE